MLKQQTNWLVYMNLLQHAIITATTIKQILPHQPSNHSFHTLTERGLSWQQTFAFKAHYPALLGKTKKKGAAATTTAAQSKSVTQNKTVINCQQLLQGTKHKIISTCVYQFECLSLAL